MSRSVESSDSTPAVYRRFDYSPSPRVFDYENDSIYTENTFNSIGVEERREFSERSGPHYYARHAGYMQEERQMDFAVRHSGYERERRDSRERRESRERDHPDFAVRHSGYHREQEIMVKIERGYAGVCGVKYPYNVGDTYWCDDRQLGLRTHCQVVSSTLHLCCVDTDGCDDVDDMRAWRF
jgi:hypothetical protein